MNPSQQRFQKSITTFPSFLWYMVKNLPSVIFWGCRLKKLNMRECQTSVPFTYRTKNPFRSIYFSALCGTAELASGILCMLHLSGKPSVSMLVTGFEATFIKKATQTIFMSCVEGEKISAALQQLSNKGDTATLQLPISASNQEGETVATFIITWSFRKR
ncbi:protein of unknown function [Cyclobacterium lianum]|uniref:Acyl-coenzyme A thioesterase PaaI, contains HGG motif n=1 Tax=Cyclobacterium lianum TaxID=388280 RepID=A0A1M7P6D8_9BACT|nr:DUF4442 domain-containing protein [Cyclobacterium lianum]SHN12202.1 protein of unknown function [Cyclobacterium lianum]